MRKAGELKQHEEDELGGEVLPQQLARSSDVSVKVFLCLRALHGVHHQVHQLLLQHRASLLLLGRGRRECVKEGGKVGRRFNRKTKRGTICINTLLKNFELLPLLHTDMEKHFFNSLHAGLNLLPACHLVLFFCSSNPTFTFF